jgi:hypothetical protein
MDLPGAGRSRPRLFDLAVIDDATAAKRDHVGERVNGG